MKNTLLKTGIAGSMIALSLLSVSSVGAEERDAKVAGTSQEVHITTNGKTLVRGAKITAISGSSITATDTWGSSVVTWNIATDANTKFARKFGGASSISELSVNDILSFEGVLNQSGTAFSVQASVVKDWSVQKERSTIGGTVSSISGQTFVLHTENRGDVTVTVSASTTLMKAGATIAFGDIKVADRISAATGVLDTMNHTLQAEKVVVYVNKGLLEKRTFEGKLKSLAGTTVPTSIVVTVGKIDYSVNVGANISVVSKNWLAVGLDKMKIGDTIRFYGMPHSDNTAVVDASIVRDASI